MNDQLAIIVRDTQLEPAKADAVLERFSGAFEEARRLEDEARSIVVVDEGEVSKMQRAREIRLKLKNIRVGAENTRKQLKEQSLRECRAIDGVANVIKALIVPLEEHLEAQEKYAELAEQKRMAETVGKRRERLLSLGANPDVYNIGPDVSDAIFNALVKEIEKAAEMQKAAAEAAERERAEKEQAEKERIAKIEKENERLRIQQEKERRERAEREKEEAERLDIERRARLEAERELEETRKADAEAKLKQEQEAHEAEIAPDKDKLVAYSERLRDFEAPAGLTEMSEAAREIVKRTERALLVLSQKVVEAASQL